MAFRSPRLILPTGCVFAILVLGLAGLAAARDASAAGKLHVAGRRLMQGGDGGAGGAGGAGGSGGDGGTPGLGGGGGLGGLGGAPGGIDGANGANGQPGGPIPVIAIPAPTPAPTSAPTKAPTKAPSTAPATAAPAKILPALLGPVLVQSVSNATETKTCASPSIFTIKGISNSAGKGIVQVKLLLPNENPPPLAMLNVKTYDVSSISFAGITANTDTSIITIDGKQKLVVTFDDKASKLESLNGTTVTVNGFLKLSAGPDYVYSALVKVCP